MGKLRILPGNLADMIAAGEVVTRPASVIKELMENALDAGAGSVSVVITDAGRTAIQVIDNGCGMSADDAVLAFERHATSKISCAEDLGQIMTFGFRGEALAAICAVAEVTLKTRRTEDELGTMVSVKASKVEEVSEIQTARGSNFMVRNLFYNIPARRKFLKSDKVELKHMVDEFVRVALTRPDAAFSLTADGRDIYVLKPAQSLKFRIADIAGASSASELIDLSEQTTLIGIEGFIGRPESARKTQSNQYFFVNGRYFRSSYLHKAVMKAYGEFVPEGSSPSYFIYLSTDPHNIDVNIHPTKAEIKFEDDSLVFQILYACVREALGRNAFGEGIDFDREGMVELPVTGRNFDEFRQMGTAQSGFDPSFDPFDTAGTSPASSFKPDSNFSGTSAWSDRTRHATDAPQDYGALFESSTISSSQSLILKGKYIIIPSRSGMMIINIRRAWQRILYERFLEAITSSSRISQQSLFPVQLRIGIQNRMIIDDNASRLEQMGFDISPFGSDTIVVGGVPEGFAQDSKSIENMIGDLLQLLSDNHSGIEDMVNSAFAEKLAILGSTSASEIRNNYEAQKMIDALFSCSNTERTPGGRKIMSIVDIEEIESRFK